MESQALPDALHGVSPVALWSREFDDIPRPTRLCKRAIDLTVSLLALTVLAPLLVAIAIAVRLDSPGPIIFRQRRAGRGGEPFEMYKFRTMSADADTRIYELVDLDDLPSPIFKLRTDPRVTRLGRVLRRWSLDELPQLINVIKREMSLVGPRPEQLDLVDRYSAEHRVRLTVKPGMTGPMQVSGRADLTIEERLAVERAYIEHLSLSRDMGLLLRTVPAVLRGNGAY